MRDLRGVEIFRAGTWNNETYTEDDLDPIVAASKVLTYLPPLKLGHGDGPGGRACKTNPTPVGTVLFRLSLRLVSRYPVAPPRGR